MNRLVRIAEDSEFQGAVYRELLARKHMSWEPCEVNIYPTGLDLIDDVKRGMEQGMRTPVCILDQNMDGLSGLQTAKLLLGIDPGILLILITASSTKDLDLDDAELRQHLFILKKPTEPQILRSQIGVMLQLWNDKRYMDEQERNLRRGEESMRQMWEALNLERTQTERTNAAQQAFLTAVTHEIQTPMNGILGMSYLLAETGLDNQQVQFLKAIEQSAHQLLSVMGDILDYSRYQSGSLALDKAPLNLCELFDSVIELNATSAYDKGLRLYAVMPEEVPELWEADAARIRQMLLNLVGNAIKFTHKGEITFGVDIDRPGGSLLRFWVRDTGIGIPQEMQATIFQAFRQEQSGMDRKYGGIGLGLAVTSELVRLMDGVIGLESAPGKGSHFWFQVPLTRLGNAQRPPASHKVIFIGVRDPMNRRVLAAHLGRLGYYCESTGEPEEIAEVLLTALGTFAGVVVEDAVLDQLDEQSREDIFRQLPPLSVLLKTNFQMHSLWPLQWSINEPITFQSINALFGTAKEVHVHRDIDRSTLKVLVVDDHPLNLKVATKILFKCGYLEENVGMVQDGRQALELLQKCDYDIVLLDCQMPGMDGFTCAEAIRKGDADVLNSKVPIIAMTANTSSEDRKRCSESGMNAFLPKPIQAERLDDSILRCIHISRVVNGAPERSV